MNKKLLLGAALLVGFGTTLTSCVDSTESASVTNIRNAKAEQLKSIADLNKAQAQAAIMLAQAEQAAQAANQAYQEAQAAKLAAEAEYLKAQAEYWSAQALVEKAKAEAMSAETEAEKQRLAMELREREKDLEKAQVELEIKQQQLKDMQAAADRAEKELDAYLAQMEQTIERMKYQALKEKQEYENMVQAAINAAEDREQGKADAIKREYGNLVRQYDQALSNLNQKKLQVAIAKANLMSIQAQLVSVKQSLQSSIKNDEEQIINWQKEIDAAQAEIDAFAKYAGKEVTAQEVADALGEKQDAEAAMGDAQNDWIAKSKDAKKAIDALYNSDYVSSLRNLVNNSSDYFYGKDKMGNTLYTTFQIKRIYESDIDAPAECLNTYSLVVTEYLYDANTSDDLWKPETITYTPVSNYGADFDYKDVYLNLGDYTTTYSYRVYTSNYDLIDNGAALQTWLEYKETALKDHNPNKPEDIQKQLDAAKEAVEEAQAAYDEAFAAVAPAKTAKEAAAAQATTDAAAVAPAQTAANTAAQALVTAQAEFDALTEPGENATEAEKTAYAAAKTKLDNAKTADTAAKTALTAAQTKATASATAATEASDAYDDAVAARDAAYADLNDAISEVNDLTVKLNMAINGDATYTVDLDNAKEDVAEVIELSKGNGEEIEAVNAAVEATEEAYVAYQEADRAYVVASSTYSTLQDCLNYKWLNGGDSFANNRVQTANSNIKTYTEWIEKAEARITENKAKIEEVEAGNNPNNDFYASEVARQQAEVEYAENEEALAQDQFDRAKAELEAFVKSQE